MSVFLLLQQVNHLRSLRRSLARLCRPDSDGPVADYPVEGIFPNSTAKTLPMQFVMKFPVRHLATVATKLAGDFLLDFALKSLRFDRVKIDQNFVTVVS